jgi:alpha-N-arabinofuranosidase
LKKAKVTVHPDYKIDKVDKRLFGAFLEPIGNLVYGGMYNPEHPTAWRTLTRPSFPE